jgi:hypothetical protein
MSANLVEVVTPMPDGSAKTRASAALERVKAFKIVTTEDYAAAAAMLAQIKGQWKEVDGQREELKAPSLEACRRVENFFRDPLKFLKDGEAILKQKITVYDTEQERLRREEQRRAEEAARREREAKEAAAREAARKAQEAADAARREAEAKRQAEEKARREAEEARVRGDREAAAAADRAAQLAAKEAARFDTRAERVESAGAEKVASLQMAASAVVAPVIQRATPKVSGLTMRDVWKFEVTDPSKINAAFLMPDEQKIRKQVAALKADAAAIIGPGVRIWSEKVPASGAA